MRFFKASDGGGELSPSLDLPPAPPPGISRRQFAIGVGASTWCLSAQAAEQAGHSEPHSRPDDLSPENWAEAQARYQNTLRVYSSRLSASQQEMIFRVLVTNQHMLASIRSFLVQNGDASACTLRVIPPSTETAGL